MWFYTLLVLYLSSGRSVADTYHFRATRQADHDNGTSCRTPDNRSGICNVLDSCDSLYQLLVTNGRNATAADFLRKSQCGRSFENGRPIVCCPDPVVEMTVTKPNVTNGSTTTQKPKIPQTTAKTAVSKPNVTNGSTTTQKPKIPHTTGKYAECGRAERQETRIVNTGKNATLGHWPWMVALGYRTKSKSNLDFKCGATLISDRWIIAAAHCVQNVSNFHLTTARLGDLDLNPNVTDNATPTDESIVEIIPHPEYTTDPITNDIALLRLRYAVTFNKYIRPICLLGGTSHLSDVFYFHKRPFYVGWGAVDWQRASSTRLQETTINVVNSTVCASEYVQERTAKIDQRVLCAGEKNKDSCQGDSGGSLIFPLIANGTVFYYLGGIASFGFRCPDHSLPGVFTRVAAFSDWISQTTGVHIT